MLVVVDTNVLVSAFLNPYGKPADIIGLVVEGKAVVCYDARILAEYYDVLHRSKFNFIPSEVDDIIDIIKAYGAFFPTFSCDIKGVHHNDMPFAQVSIAAQAKYLITGNTAHFPKRIEITAVVSPSIFLEGFHKLNE
jgi:putative PIN family toxin of toxin-antitoxin system